MQRHSVGPVVLVSVSVVGTVHPGLTDPRSRLRQRGLRTITTKCDSRLVVIPRGARFESFGAAERRKTKFKMQISNLKFVF